jgi:ribonuclease Z
MGSSMQVLFLGTSGSVPTPERNVPAVALKIGKEIILFDCGEGTQRQFMNSPFSFMQVTKILISHLHGDHFLGTNALIQTMSFNERKDKIEIFGPAGTKKTIEAFLKLGYFDPSFEIIVSDLHNGQTVNFGDYFITAVESEHTVPSLAFAVQERDRPGRFNRTEAERLGIPPGPLYQRLQDGKTVSHGGKEFTPDMVIGPPRPGRKVVYSGDTKPCKAVMELAHNCDILIHDGTADSSLEDKANKYGHSTTRQAASIARDSNARALMIFHVSPRYETVDKLLAEAREVFKDAIIAHDLMQVDVKLSD